MTGELVAELKGHARALILSQDGSHVVSGSDDRTVVIWDMPVMTGESQLLTTPKHQNSTDSDGGFSGDQAQMAIQQPKISLEILESPHFFLNR